MIRRTMIVISLITISILVIMGAGYLGHSISILGKVKIESLNNLKLFAYFLFSAICVLFVIFLILVAIYILISFITGIVNYIKNDRYEINWDWPEDFIDKFDEIFKK